MAVHLKQAGDIITIDETSLVHDPLSDVAAAVPGNNGDVGTEL
jgi:hypothetical protein